MAARLGSMAKSAYTITMPRLATFAQYAKVELVPPTPGQSPQGWGDWPGFWCRVQDDQDCPDWSLHEPDCQGSHNQCSDCCGSWYVVFHRRVHRQGLYCWLPNP